MTVEPRHTWKLDISAPVIVGGIGGSGTRLVATLLEQMGIYMGHYRTPEMDSGFFGKLIGRYPHLWNNTDPAIYRRLKLFAKLHLGKFLFPHDLPYLYGFVPEPQGEQFRLVIRRAYFHSQRSRQYLQWGFKHPSSLYYLVQLAHQFPNSKYVHVIRHGLDMVYSTNVKQIQNWGKAFNIEMTEITESQRLDFWIRVNQWTLEQCRLLFPGRFHVISFDRLCTDKEEEVRKLIDFIGFTPQASIPELLQYIRSPHSMGRYKEHHSVFSQSQLQEVKNFGFEVEVIAS